MRKSGASKSKNPMDGPITGQFGPLFSSQVHPQQTSSHPIKPKYVELPPKGEAEKRLDAAGRPYEYYVPPATPRETAFRHSGWIIARNRINAALRASGRPAARIERFEKCGADCMVEVNETGSRFRLRAHYCGDRFCQPCGRARSVRVQQNLLQLVGTDQLRFITLTLAEEKRTLAAQLHHLRASFARLRRSKLWCDNVRGGAAFVEVTRGKKGDHWHVHLHVLCCGLWLDATALSDAWRVASVGSYIVDIRAVNDNENTVKYVAKYASKGIDASVIRDDDSLAEAIASLSGSRLISTFGTWHGVDVEDEPADATVWKSLGRLDFIIMSAERGETWAMHIPSILRSKEANESPPKKWVSRGEFGRKLIKG